MSKRKLKPVIEEVYAVAKASGDRAYQFVQTAKGLVEVRVWPDGTVKVTPVDARGVPLPKSEFTFKLWHKLIPLMPAAVALYELLK